MVNKRPGNMELFERMFGSPETEWDSDSIRSKPDSIVWKHDSTSNMRMPCGEGAERA